MRLIILNISFLFFITINQALASVVVSFGMAQGTLINKPLSNNKGNANGMSSSLKIGYKQKTVEFGAYTSNGSFSTDIKHDGTTSELSYDKSSFGLYLTYYRPRIYFGIGYGKSVISEKLEGLLSATEQTLLESIYDVASDGINTTEGTFSLGLRVFTLGTFVGAIYGQKVLQFDSSHSINIIGFELKTSI